MYINTKKPTRLSKSRKLTNNFLDRIGYREKYVINVFNDVCGQGLHDLRYTTTNDYPLLMPVNHENLLIYEFHF